MKSLLAFLGAALLSGVAQAQIPSVVSEIQARADFFDYVSPVVTVSQLRAYHGSDSGAGDPLVFTFTAGRGFAPQQLPGTVQPARQPRDLAGWCARTGSGFKGGRLVRSEARDGQGEQALRLTYQQGSNFCVIVTDATPFLTHVDASPQLFTRYITAKPGQIRSLSIMGSDFRETRLVLRFRATGQVRYPQGANLKASLPAEAKQYAEDTECRILASRAEEVVLSTVPSASTNVGRLVVRDQTGDNRSEYCVIVWNTDK